MRNDRCGRGLLVSLGVLAACLDSGPGVTGETEATGTSTGGSTSTEPGTSTTTVPTTGSTVPLTTEEPTTGAPTTSTTNDPSTTGDPSTTSGTTSGTSTGPDPDGSSGGTSTTGLVAVCGDGVQEGDEACDDGPQNSDVVQGACRTDCTAAGCGDGVVDYALGEECEDGNLADGDGCGAGCKVEASPSCGDGALDIDEGEECDDGDLAAGDGCSPTCQLEAVGATCGDGQDDPLEVCDDGDVDNGDACNPTCNLGNETTLFVGSPGVQGSLDGMGMAARIGGPGALTVDQNALYLADSMNHTIRKVDMATAAVTTLAGSAGMPGFADGAGPTARFMGVEAITTDGTSLWVADTGNRRLRKVDLQTNAVTTEAGGTQGLQDGIGAAAQFDDLRGLVYRAGFVYMVDASGAVLRRFDPATKEVVTLAGQAYTPGNVDGYGMAAQFVSPRYMTSDNSGVLYIADTNGATIRTYNTVTTHVGTFAGIGVQGYVDGVGPAAAIHRPRGMASDGTSIYFTEFNQHTVRQGVLATQAVSTNIGKHCDGNMNCAGGYVEGVGTAALLNGPYGLAFHFPTNSLFVLDSANRVIRRIQ